MKQKENLFRRAFKFYLMENTEISYDAFLELLITADDSDKWVELAKKEAVAEFHKKLLSSPYIRPDKK